MGKLKFLLVASVCSVAGFPATASDIYGGASTSAVYSTSDLEDGEDGLDGSAIVTRGYAGVRWDPRGDVTRLQVSSAYFGYLNEGRDDRWSNVLEAEKQLRLGDKARLSLEASAASNIWTLERRSADQLAGAARLTLEPNRRHRVSVAGGLRRRYYDGIDARSWSPVLEADYRYRFGSWNFLALEARHERNNSDRQTLDYRRLSLSAFYTHPLGRDTRVRAGIVHRRWKWDERFAPDGDRLVDASLTPQLRLTQEVSRRVDLELDYRRLFRSSNDDSRDRNDHRLAATVRAEF